MKILQENTQVYKTRNQSMDVIRTIAIISVVALHTMISYLSVHENDYDFILRLIGVYSNIGVPFFFMLSGYLLTNENNKHGVSKEYKNRFQKIVIPLTTWSVIFIIIKYFFNSPMESDNIIPILSFPVVYHLWYLYALMSIYLILPIVRLVLNNIEKNYYMLLLLVWFSLEILFPFIGYLVPNFIIFDKLRCYFPTSYLGYFITGDFIRRYSKQFYSSKFRYYIFIVGVVESLYFYYDYYYANKKYFSLNFDYFSIFTFFFSTILFIVLINDYKSTQNGIISHFCELVSRASYGIYFVHVLFINLYDMFFSIENIFLSYTLKFCLVLLLSYITSYILKKVRVLSVIFLGERI